MINQVANFIFSKHNSLPRTSIIFAVCFLAGFMALNIFSFHQNSKRIALIESINRQNLPNILSEIQEKLIGIDEILDNHELPRSEKEQKFDMYINEATGRLHMLQDIHLIDVHSDTLKEDFTKIFATLHTIQETKKSYGLEDNVQNENIMAGLHKALTDFFDINHFAQTNHQQRVEKTLDELRREENYLLSLGLACVVLGSLMIIFLLVDLFRRGELLERANQADRLKNSFFAMMSHEIRTPINGILGTLSLLSNTKLDENQKHLAGVVHSSAASLLVIVNDVLDYSKIEAGKLELEYSNFNLKDLLESVFELIRPLAAEKKLNFAYTIAGHVSLDLHCDPARIRQILLNFLSNAIKFTDNGSVMLNVRSETLHQTTSPTPYLRFDVVDTGMGISEESKAHLFREFSQVDGSYTRRFAGTGLGLAICRRLTDMMNGYIGVESAIGKGSTFWFSVPLVVAEEVVSGTCELPRTLNKDIHAKLLLVEDNPTNQMIAEAFLKQGGHHVDLVDNGRKAVEAVRSKDYDVVFMDIAMPEMDGFAATKAIRAMGGKWEKLPIVAMTAHAMRGDREECLAIGMNDYITKPLSRETLLQRVSLWYGGGSTMQTEKKPDLKEGATMQPAPKQNDTPDSTSKNNDPEISEQHFNQILEDLGFENLADFSNRFYDDLKDTGAAMLEAAKQEQWDKVKLHSHSMKSSSLSFGLIRLSRLASLIEQQCKNNVKPDPSLLQAWPEHVSTAIAALNERFKTINIPPVA